VLLEVLGTVFFVGLIWTCTNVCALSVSHVYTKALMVVSTHSCFPLL
jgi:hypothetical protein